jgi:hypothetical protein
MADERDETKPEETTDHQATGGQQSHRSEYGQQGAQTDGSAGQPIGGNDSSLGSGTTLSQGAEFGEEPASEGEGFILQQGQGSDDLRQGSPEGQAKSPSGAAATGGTDFANQGRGATDEEDKEA